MKRFFSLAAAVIIAVSAFGADRAHTLKIYNWADYIDISNVLETFPAWYKVQTGEDVEVVYQTFDINESMLTQIEVGHEDYDVVCPSEYIIERMLRQGLLLPIDKNFGSTPDYTKLVAPYAEAAFQQMAPDTSVHVADYTVGYMGGTTGILYNPALLEKAGLTEADVQSWGVLQNPKLKGKILMKDAFRDIYSVLVLYCYRNEIASGEVTRADLVANITPERIERVKQFLIDMKSNIAGWEVDFGKEDMAKGSKDFVMDVMWSGDAQWAIDNEAEGVELKYVVPEEGSNIWFDGWVIPKYAQNVKAASYFIDYLCMPQNAILNMEEIGYVSCIASPEIMEWANDSAAFPQTVNAVFQFGPVGRALHANPVFYPDSSVMARCALMHDCGDQTQQMLDMWNQVKGDNLNTGMMIFLAGVVVVLAIIVIFYWGVGRRRQRRTRMR